jgi:cytochrome c oxidase subunit I+III
MYATGLPAISIGFFSAASEAVVIPTGVQIFVFIATLLTGRVIFSTPLLFIAGALAIFLIGGLTGVMVALAPFDWQAHDTYFVVAHLHYVLIGGMLFPIVAGFYYYFPLVTGKKLSDRLGRTAFWLMFSGFNIAFLPMHLTGLRGMPRRVFTYPEGLGWDTLNMVSTVGAFIFAAGILVVLLDVMRPKRRQPYAERNPWNAGTLEWLCEMPGKPWGVRSIPLVTSRYPLWEQANFVRDVDEGRFFLPDAEEGERETLVTSVLDAEGVQCLRVPGPTFLTMAAAVFTGGVFIFATYHWYAATAVSGVLALASIIAWLWTGTAVIPEKDEKHIGHGRTLPLYMSGPRSVGWWAMCITMIGDMTAFFSLVFTYFFFWTVNPSFPPEAAPGPGVLWPAVALAMLIGAWALTTMARRWNARDRVLSLRAGLALAIVLAAASMGALVFGVRGTGLDPTASSYGATVWVLILWLAAHVAVGSVMQAYCIARSMAGKLTGKWDIEIRNVSLYWHFLAFTAAATTAVIALFPLVD